MTNSNDRMVLAMGIRCSDGILSYTASLLLHVTCESNQCPEYFHVNSHRTKKTCLVIG